MKTGVSSLQDGQVIEGKDLRPCHTEYPLTSASARPNRRAIRLGQAAAGDLEDVARLGSTHPASYGHAPSPPARTAIPLRMSAPSPNITMNWNHARPCPVTDDLAQVQASELV